MHKNSLQTDLNLSHATINTKDYNSLTRY